jgi:superfamily I DNA/RNA helicase
MFKIRYLINDNGMPFDSSEIASLSQVLDCLSNENREIYRDNNASEIAKHTAVRTLIVSGPGTGKSFLFLDRINNWYKNDSQATVVVTSFVRKLVADLQKDIINDKNLNKKQKANTTVTTLHKFARSIVEKNHGTSKHKFQPHFKIIGESWKNVVWSDVLDFFPGLDSKGFGWKMFEKQLHNYHFDISTDWSNIKDKYFELCKFYNASGFADLILRAKIALEENTSLNSNDYFIIDEYQDFNLAEDSFINQLSLNAKGLLIVGDDEQVLYEELKSGKADLIRNKYHDKNIVNAMLPFSGRCSFHITKATSYFIQQCRNDKCIQKIYLPLKTSDGSPKIKLVACAHPATAADYIEKFVADNKTAIDGRKAELESGDKKDAFLLILTPAKKIKFLHGAKERIFKILSEYQVENRSFSDDYYKVLAYYSLSNDHSNNFAFRKVMHYERIPTNIIHSLIANAINNNQNFSDLNTDETTSLLTKCDAIKAIISSNQDLDEKIRLMTTYLTISDQEKFKTEFITKEIGQSQITAMGHEEDEEAELEEIEVKRMGAIELVTMVGSKGLSADHVIIIGFDNINMSPVTKNAFYVAMARARSSLHIITSLKSGGSQNTHAYLDFLPEENVEFYSYRKSDHSIKQINNKAGFKKYLSNLNSKSKAPA